MFSSFSISLPLQIIYSHFTAVLCTVEFRYEINRNRQKYGIKQCSLRILLSFACWASDGKLMENCRFIVEWHTQKFLQFLMGSFQILVVGAHTTLERIMTQLQKTNYVNILRTRVCVLGIRKYFTHFHRKVSHFGGWSSLSSTHFWKCILSNAMNSFKCIWFELWLILMSNKIFNTCRIEQNDRSCERWESSATITEAKMLILYGHSNIENITVSP